MTAERITACSFYLLAFIVAVRGFVVIPSWEAVYALGAATAFATEGTIWWEKSP